MTAVETAVETTAVETFAPLFNGFYGTIWESIIDSNEEMEIDYYVNELGKDVTYDDFTIDYTKLHNDYAIEIHNQIEHELKNLNIITSMKFEKLVSPKFYNYANDAINTTIEFSEDNIKEIKNILTENSDDWEMYLESHFTSCSGFMSRYSNDVNNSDWNIDKIFKFGFTQIGFVLDFILSEVNDITEMYIYEDVEFYVGEYMELTESE